MEIPGKHIDDYTKFCLWFLVKSYKVRCWCAAPPRRIIEAHAPSGGAAR